jgi:hypothetical protein
VTLINWLLKPKCMLIHIFKIFFVIWKYNMIFYFIFERLSRMHENNFFLMFWRKLAILIPDVYLYSIKIQTNIYWSKWSKKFAENHRFFWNNFWNFFFFGLDLAGLTGLLAQASDPAGQIRGTRELPHAYMQQLLLKWIIIHLNSKT